jgi:solute carrier family 12 (potassium/chloride transporters), member 9
LDFANDLKKGGIYIIGNVKKGDYKDLSEKIEKEQIYMDELIKKEELKAFSHIVFSDSIKNGVQNLILTGGLGGMHINTVIIGSYSENSERETENNISDLSEYIEIITNITSTKNNLIITKK